MEQIDLLDSSRSAVVVIDLQGKLLEMTYRWELAVTATTRLLRLAEIFRRPVILTEQYPEGLGPTHPDLRTAYDALDTEKRYVAKVSFGCCGEPNLMDELQKIGRKQVIVTGMEAHVCVYQTVLGLLEDGCAVHLLRDAICSRTKDNFQAALANSAAAGAVVSTTEMALFQMLQEAGTPEFKAIAKLLK